MRRLRKVFSSFLALLIFTVSGPWKVLAQPATSTIVGTVVNAQQKPVPDVKIVIKDSSGKALRETLTNGDGRYSLKDVNTGQYQLTLDPLQNRFQGETVVANLGSQDLTVNWMVSAAAVPVAMASQVGPDTGGLFGLGDAWTVVIVNVVGGGFGTGMAAAFGGFDSKKSKTTGSPSL
jgi:hypothetical protein